EDYEDEGRELTGFTVSWDLVPEHNFLKLKEITSDASSDIAIVSGYFPDSADAYTCGFRLIATVTSLENEQFRTYAVGTKSSFDVLELSVVADVDHIAPTSSDFAKYVIYNSKDVNLHEVNSDYSVTITVSDDYDSLMDYYDRYIRSDSAYSVNIPEWMTYEIKGEQTSFSTEELRVAFEDENNGRALTHIVLKLNDEYDGKLLGELQDGTKARVNIPLVSRDDYDALEIVLSWDVVYRKDPEPFAITSAKTFTFNLEPGSKDKGTAEYTGSAPVSIASKDTESDVKFTARYTGKGVITVNVEADKNAKDGVYENVLTFTDAKGNSDALTVKVTVKKPTPPAPQVNPINITGEPKAFTLKAGESAKTTLTASGGAGGKVTWSIGAVTPTADILVSSRTLSDTSAEFSVVVGKTVAAGSYSVNVNAADTAGTSSSVKLTITVTADTAQDETKDNPQDNSQENQQDNPQENPQDNQQDNTEDNSQSNTDAQNLTEKIRITNNSGSSLDSRPLSTLTAGTRAVYVISLEGTGITATAWRLLINGVEVDASSLSEAEAVSQSASSWARIVKSDETSATVEAEPPANLSVDSQVSLAVTGTDGKEYTADLGTVEKAESTGIGVGPGTSGGCSTGFGVLVFLSAFCFCSERKRKQN
ncbi:MAG: hypothetical protein IJ587_08300, partial [Synergistaceae bacterium]|nr:hypothetical protein [Synergistaceae bacterium]